MIETKVVWFKDFTRWDVDFFIGTQNILTNFKLEFLGNMLKPRKEKIRANNYDGITPIVSKIPFSTEHIEIRKDLTTKMDMYAVYKDDLLVSNINFHQGALAICKDDKLFASTHYQPYIIDNKLINSKFLIFILKSKAFQDYVKTKKTKGIKTESNFNFIKNLQIPLPPMEIQNKIVADIEEIQNKIKALQKQEKELKDEIERYIYIALGLEKEQKAEQKKAFVVEFKDLKQWDIEYHQKHSIKHKMDTKYKIVNLGSICESNVGVIYSPSNISNSGIPVLRANNIQDGQIDYKDLVYIENTKISTKKLANKGDILMSICNGSKNLVGKTAIIDKDGFSFGSFMAIIRSNFNDYIIILLQTNFFRERLFEFRTNGINQISQKNIKNLQIPLPPLNIQKEIVNFVENKKKIIKENQIKIIDLTKEINNTIDKIFVS